MGKPVGLEALTGFIWSFSVGKKVAPGSQNATSSSGAVRMHSRESVPVSALPALTLNPSAGCTGLGGPSGCCCSGSGWATCISSTFFLL